MRWELKYYWGHGITMCRYFPTEESARAFAESKGYPVDSYKVVRA